jgi:hypothetical protein
MTTAVSPDSIWRRLWFTRIRDVIRGRWDASLDWRRLVAMSNLPDELSQAVCQVVGKSRLWRSEKFAVAAELVCHFQDGLDAGISAAELRQSFGDPQTAAQLIRRAKRRNRSLAWHAWRYAATACAALAGAYILMGLWMSMGRPTIRTDYLAMLTKQPAAVPESERAWPLYRDALLAMGAESQDETSPAKKFLSGDAKPGDAGWNDKEKFLSDNADSIAKLREAAGRGQLGFVASTSHAGFTDKDRELFGVKLAPEEIEADKHRTLEDRWIISTLIPDVNQLRNSSLLLAADARRAAIAGDGKTAFEDVIALLGVSRHCEEMPFLVCLMVAESVQAQARSVIRDVLADNAAVWTDAQLRDMAHKLAASRIDWRRGIEGERISFYDSMQRLYTDNGRGDGRLALQVTRDQNLFQMLDAVSDGTSGPSILQNRGVAMLTLPAANMLVASRKDMVSLFDKITTDVEAKVDEPHWKRAAGTRWDAELQALASGPIGKFRYLFVNMLIPAHDKVQNRVTMSDGERDGVFLGLALELFHRKHNKWPAALAELSPQYLPQVPVDPITGKPLHYKIVDDRPVVYSVGADGDDDGGRPTTDEVAATLPPTAPKGPPPQDGDWVIWSTVPSD